MINTNGGFMKQYNGNKQQWLLCAALIMALGSQSYYQVASNQVSSVELASLNREPQAETKLSADAEKKLSEIQKQIESNYLEKHKADDSKTDNAKLYEFYKSYEQTRLAEAKKETDAEKKSVKITQAKNFKVEANKFASLVSAEKKEKIKPVKVVAAPIKIVEVAKTKTEGTAGPTQVCEGGCAPTDENIAAALKVLEAAKKIEVVKESVAETSTEVTTEIVAETAKERRERLALERQEAREAKEEAKRTKAEEIAEKKREKLELAQEKKQEEKEIRNEKFTEAAAKIAEECKEEGIECSASGLTSLLSNYTDDKKIDTGIVNKAFNQILAKDLRAALRNPEDSNKAAEALFQIQSDIPSEYRFLKTKTIDITRNEAIFRASEVSRNFKMADQLTNAKRPMEAIQYINAGNAAANAYDYSSRIITGGIVNGLNSSEDRITLDYVNRVYMPDMQKIMMSLTNPNGAEMNTQVISETGTKSESKTSLPIVPSKDETAISPAASTRNSRSGRADTVTRESKPSALEQNGVQFGTPSSSPRGGRRSN